MGWHHGIEVVPARVRRFWTDLPPIEDLGRDRVGVDERKAQAALYPSARKQIVVGLLGGLAFSPWRRDGDDASR